MTYMPIKTGGRVRSRNVTGNMPVYGTNLRDDSQLLDTRYALLIENYLVHGNAKMQKRPGQTVDFNTTESDVITLSEEYVSGFDIIGYGTKVRAYNNADETFTDIKTNFTANNGGFTGGRVGDYFFVNNFIDGLWRISRTLAYDGQTVNFTVGKKVTGTTSGATGMILEDTDVGVTGVLTLGDINGTFIDNEPITDTSGGAAIVNGVLTFAIAQVVDAPKGKVFRIIGKRAILINLATNESAYNYSATDLGTNPPFSNWTTGTGYNDPGMGSYRNGGAALDCCLIGDIIFIGQQNGWYAFQIAQTDLAGISSKFDSEVAHRENFPIFRCIMTNVGMIAASSSGILRQISLGQPNIPYSDQWESLTDDLGEDYFKDINFDNVDIMYDPLRGFIYSTVGKASATNNLVLAVKAELSGVKSSTKTGATSFFTGWNVLVFMTRENSIYGTSAVDGIRHNLFVGQKDVDVSIHSEYLQELNFALTDAFNLEEFYAKGELSPASEIVVSFDTFDTTGYYEARRWVSEPWVPQHSYLLGSPGWGEAAWGGSGWGGGSISSGLIPDFTGAKPRLRELMRVYLRFESDDFSEHVLNWFSANTTITKQVRRRTLIKAIS